MTGFGTFFSCAHPLRPIGPGRPMSRIHAALSADALAHGHEHDTVSPESFPVMADADGFGHGLGPTFDDLASGRLDARARGRGPIKFLGGGGSSLHQLRWLREHSPLSTRLTLWFSSHFEHAGRVLAPEYEAWGVTKPPVHPFVAWRAGEEQALSDVVVVPSTFCEETYPDAVREKIEIAEFGVDCNEFMPPLEGRAEGSPLGVLFPATNPMRKGLRHVVDAFKEHSVVQPVVHVMGASFSRAEGVKYFPGATFTFHGWVDDAKAKALRDECQILLLPSLEEGQALAALEGMACGMALVATPNVGVPFEDGKEGLMVKAGNAGSIGKALRYLVENPSEVVRMGREARMFAEKRTWERFGERIVKIVREAA